MESFINGINHYYVGNLLSRHQRAVEELRDEMVISLTNMCTIPAIAPESGGDGELERAQFLLMLLDKLGFENVEILKSKDQRVSAGYRPNIIVTVPGEDRKLPPIWVVSHMDVVPEGDRDLWEVDPFKPELQGNRLVGRGVEDNGQELIASLYAAKGLLNAGLKPKRNVKLAFVADEEVGSTHGIKYLVDKKLFSEQDLIIVPDAGTPDGNAIEVVEKSHLQLKVVTHGKQAHASRPCKGINAFRAASRFLDRVTTALYEKFDQTDRLFTPPHSTFEATKKEANVPNINTIPGEDVFYMDCRILPSLDLDGVLKEMKQVAREVGKETGAKITFENVRMSKAPPATPPDSVIVKNLQAAIREARGIEAKVIGIGGGTCAAFFREAGLPAAVWATNDEHAHEPNESIKIDNLVGDAKVFAMLYMM
jgi:succinyl-diaminopimelate desuccinylase